MSKKLWQKCLDRLALETAEQDIHLWIHPLQVIEQGDDLMLLAPNHFVQEKVAASYLPRIEDLVSLLSDGKSRVTLNVGTQAAEPAVVKKKASRKKKKAFAFEDTNLDKRYHFGNYVEGKSNQLARAAAFQVVENPGESYNPLLFYGGTGLGKTHLLHAIGNAIRQNDATARVIYLHSERFVNNMIKALRHNMIDEFKKEYRSAKALLIDDIQFFAGKERSQEEFFHTFNALLDGRQQIVLTCDRYPKEVEGLEARLKSRFGWGVNIPVEPPDFETRVAILTSKAAEAGIPFDQEVAFFIAKRMNTHVRDLEGALNTLCANAKFTGRPITLAFAKETLRDLLAVHDRLLNIESIQRTVADYYKIRISDLLSKRRSRSITRPRQMAMWLAKHLTEHSLPEIGDAFGGRDHTTVLHACRKIESLCDDDGRWQEDRANLLRRLSA